MIHFNNLIICVGYKPITKVLQLPFLVCMWSFILLRVGLC